MERTFPLQPKEETQMKQKVATITNGVDLTRLTETIEAVKSSPDLGNFQFRLQNRWIGGGENRSEVQSFFAGGKEIPHKFDFTLVADEPGMPLEGDLDLRGFLDLSPTVRKGYQNIRLKLHIKANVTDEQLRQLSSLGPLFSPVYDSIARGVPITVSAERMA